MINDFTVKAHPVKNELKIVLDGFFMKSEIELAYYLIKNESKKLRSGYEVVVDIRNMSNTNLNFEDNFKKLEKILKKLGCGGMRFLGLKSVMAHHDELNGGIYSYENEWLF